MASVKQAIVRRGEAGLVLEAFIKGGEVKTEEGFKEFKGGYTHGSWTHIKQSDKVLLKAWKVPSKVDEK